MITPSVKAAAGGALALFLAGCGDTTADSGATTLPPTDSATGTTDSADSGVTTETVPGVEEPVLFLSFDPPGGTFTDPMAVVLTSLDDAVITYTTDGTVPLPGVHAVAEGLIPIITSTTLRAVATLGDESTEVTSRSYVELDSSVAAFTSNLPLVVLHSFEAAPTVKTEDRTPFTVNVIEPGAAGRTPLLGDATLSLRGGLKVRGSSTNGQPKAHYSLELWGNGNDDDYNAEVLGMPPESDWVLHAPLYFDRALMRNALIYGLSNDVDRWAPHTRFVEVYVADRGAPVTAGDYVGVYVVMERIKRDDNRVAIEKLEPDQLLEPEVSGGYIFKRDRTASGESGFTAGTANGAFEFAQTLVWVEPAEDEVVSQQLAWLTSYIDDFAVALSRPDHRHPTTGEHYTEWIDQGAWIDHHLLNVLTMNPDALRLSGYLFKDREDKLHAGPIWDFDRTMGCESDSRASDPTHWDASYYTSDTTYMFEHGWYKGLFDDPEFAAAYWDRWRELLDAELSLENILGAVDEMAAELVEAGPRNFDKWTDYPPRGDGTFEYEVDFLKDWLTVRHEFIAGCLALPDPESCG
jgi:hypothetical protein